MEEKIKEAVKILKEGGIGIFPTDTAFGIGCLMNNEKSVERLFRIRKRPKTMAVPVVISSVSMAEELTIGISSDVREKLIDMYWPGALTIIFNAKVDKVPKL